MEELIEIHPSWLQKKNEEQLMKRLNGIVSGRDDGPHKKDNGYAWQLDSSNNWWAELRGDKLVIACRYPTPKFDTLVAFCKEWLT